MIVSLPPAPSFARGAAAATTVAARRMGGSGCWQRDAGTEDTQHGVPMCGHTPGRPRLRPRGRDCDSRKGIDRGTLTRAVNVVTHHPNHWGHHRSIPGRSTVPRGWCEPVDASEAQKGMRIWVSAPKSRQGLARVSPGSRRGLARVSPGSRQGHARVTPGSCQGHATVTPCSCPSHARSRPPHARVSPRSHHVHTQK